MDLATFNLYVTTIGKDVILGIILDNSRRILRSEKKDPVTGDPMYDLNGNHVLETFDERFIIDPILEAIKYFDNDVSGVKTVSYAPIAIVQGFVAATKPEDVNKINFRYIIG